MPAPLFISHPSSLDHDMGPHPESPRRIEAVEAALEALDWLGHERREAPAATREQLERVHPGGYLDALEDLGRRGGGVLDPDTSMSAGSWGAALHAAGGACALAEALVRREAPAGFVACRPPGHHAEPAHAMGFCLLSNVAIAARHARALGAERVLVLDWDVHHGNGTHAVFHGSREVLFASIHQWPLYPGTGALADTGHGEGEGYTINMPVPAGSDEDDWVALVANVVVPAARAYAPDLILISAGFDAHRDDPLAGCRLETSSYGAIALWMRALADELGIGIGAVLEGGYNLGALAASVAATMEALAEGGEPPPAEPTALTRQVAAVHSQHWPDLAA